MAETMDSSISEHTYEEISPILRSDSETSIKCIDKVNSAETRYVPYDEMFRNTRSPLSNGENEQVQNTDQARAIFQQETPYSDPSETYLKLPVTGSTSSAMDDKTKRSRDEDRDHEVNMLPSYPPGTVNNETQSKKNKSRDCYFMKIPNRKAIAIFSILLNFLLVAEFVYTVTSNANDPPVPNATSVLQSSRTKRSVCINCSKYNAGHLGVLFTYYYHSSDLFEVLTEEDIKLCCMDNAEHLQWLQKMIKIAEVVLKSTGDGYPGIVLHGKRQENGQLNFQEKASYGRSSITFINGTITTENGGYYLVYFLFTMANRNYLMKAASVEIKKQEQLNKNNQRLLKQEIMAPSSKHAYAPLSQLEMFYLSRKSRLQVHINASDMIYNYSVCNTLQVALLSHDVETRKKRK